MVGRRNCLFTYAALRFQMLSMDRLRMIYIADMDMDNPFASLQAVSCTYRIVLGPRAGQKVLSLGIVAGRNEKNTWVLCADAHGFSLRAGVRCGAHQRKELERLCRYVTRPAIVNEWQL